MFKYEINDIVTIPRGVTAKVIQRRIGDGEIGPIGLNCYLCQEDGFTGQNGLSWQIEQELG